jgi:4-hydroxybenzoate polyprenyltransferase
MKKMLLRLGDYVFVMRPLLLIPAWSFYLLGSAAGRRAAGVAASPFLPFSNVAAAFYYGFACLTTVLITAYLLNQVFDQESDRRNRKGHFLTTGIFTVKTVVLMAIVTFLIASYLFRFVADAQRIPLALALVLSLAYSVPPLRLVSRPFVDLLANAVGYGGIAFVTGFAAWSPRVAQAASLAVPYVLLVGATFLHTTILDADGDREAGKKTTSVVIGVGPSAVLACLLSVAGLAPAIFVSLVRYGDKLAPMILTLCAAVFIHAAVTMRRVGPGVASSNAAQAATVLVTLPALVASPGYAVVLLPVVAAARWYYGARFGITYPGPARTPTAKDS